MSRRLRSLRNAAFWGSLVLAPGREARVPPLPVLIRVMDSSGTDRYVIMATEAEPVNENLIMYRGKGIEVGQPGVVERKIFMPRDLSKYGEGVAEIRIPCQNVDVTFGVPPTVELGDNCSIIPVPLPGGLGGGAVEVR